MSEKFTHGLVGELNADRESRAAFSLVELLVVIAIITLLASILLPSYAQMRERARNIVCYNNLRQLTIAHCTYAVDNKGWFPYVPGGNDPARWGGIRWYKGYILSYIGPIWGEHGWNHRIDMPPGKYLSDYHVFYCPGALKYGTLKCWTTEGRYHDADLLFMAGGDHRNNNLGYWPMMGGRADLDPPLPSRPGTGYRPLRASAKGLCWMVTDRYAKTSADRVNTATAPHHLGEIGGATAPYNVGHVDGHVDSHQFDPTQRLGSGCADNGGCQWAGGWPGQWPYPHFDTENDRKGR